MICKNCSTEFEGNYCSNCGQKKVTNRLNFKEIWNDLISSIINYETGFLKTLFFLIIKPKKIITNYINGKRKSYFNPIKLLFIILTIKTFIEIKLLNNSTKELTESVKLTTIITENDFFKLFLIIVLIPILSFLSYYFFKKYKYNFTEHILINTYALSISSVFVISSYLINTLIENKNTGLIGILIDLLFFSWVYANLFNNNRFVSIVKAVLIMILGYLLFLLPIFAIARLF
jgi:hypothetical protein